MHKQRGLLSYLINTHQSAKIPECHQAVCESTQLRVASLYELVVVIDTDDQYQSNQYVFKVSNICRTRTSVELSLPRDCGGLITKLLVCCGSVAHFSTEAELCYQSLQWL